MKKMFKCFLLVSSVFIWGDFQAFAGEIDVEVTLDYMSISGTGDNVGKGELYWEFYLIHGQDKPHYFSVVPKEHYKSLGIMHQYFFKDPKLYKRGPMPEGKSWTISGFIKDEDDFLHGGDDDMGNDALKFTPRENNGWHKALGDRIDKYEYNPYRHFEKIKLHQKYKHMTVHYTLTIRYLPCVLPELTANNFPRRFNVRRGSEANLSKAGISDRFYGLVVLDGNGWIQSEDLKPENILDYTAPKSYRIRGGDIFLMPGLAQNDRSKKKGVILNKVRPAIKQSFTSTGHFQLAEMLGKEKELNKFVGISVQLIRRGLVRVTFHSWTVNDRIGTCGNDLGSEKLKRGIIIAFMNKGYKVLSDLR